MIPVSKPSIGSKEIMNVMECLLENQISSQGKFIEKFENEFSAACGVHYGAACSNGTTALHLALKSIGIGHGDEVILPSFTMIATANAVLYCGAKPIFVDSLPDTWNMDPSDILRVITPKTKAIIVVHTYGLPVDMDNINEIASANGLMVVEDAAEAHGALYKDRRVGSLGDVACFSFYGNKILTTGEGGMVVSNNKQIIDRVKSLRNHCFKIPRFVHDDVGYNYRMTNIQAAIGCAQTERMYELVLSRLNIGQLYNKHLQGIRGIKLPFKTSAETDSQNVYWMYGIVLTDEFPLSKTELMKYLEDSGIETRSFFYPMHKQPVFAGMGNRELPVSEMLYENGLYLPTYAELTEQDIIFITNKIRELFRVKK